MKVLYLFICLLFFNLFYAQQITNLNHEKTDVKNYFTTISYNEIKGKIIMQAELNGKMYNFIFDTGAPTAISQRIVEELNLDAMGKVELRDQSAILDSVKVVNIEKLKLGDVTFKNTPAIIIKDMQLFGCFNIDGFIGSNILGNSVLQISSKNKTLTITDKPGKLNLKKKNSIEMTTKPIQNTPYIKAYYLNGDLSANETSILVDTGMDGFYDLSVHAYLHFNTTEKIEVFKTLHKANGSYSAGLNGVAQNSDSYKVFMPQLLIGKTNFTNVTVDTTPDYTSRIGSAVLDYGLMTLDFINKRFYFESFEKSETIDVKEKSWPISLSMDGEKIIVGIVWDDKLSGILKPGDEVLEFGKYNYEEMSFCEKVLTKIQTLNDAEIISVKDVTSGEIKAYRLKKS
jgi:predicted aspartyl protease